MSRYDQLKEVIRQTADNTTKTKAFRILEIGCHKGDRAKLMVQEAQKNGRSEVHYFGFDLFDEWTKEVNAKEVGKEAPPLALADYEAELRKLGKGLKINLFRGDSKKTLPDSVATLPPMDVIFVDGGHSYETCRSDAFYACQVLAPKGIMVLDDYYSGNQTEGCAKVVDELREAFSGASVDVLPATDKGADGRSIQFARFTRRQMKAVSQHAKPNEEPIQPPPYRVLERKEQDLEMADLGSVPMPPGYEQYTWEDVGLGLIKIPGIYVRKTKTLDEAAEYMAHRWVALPDSDRRSDQERCRTTCPKTYPLAVEKMKQLRDSLAQQAGELQSVKEQPDDSESGVRNPDVQAPRVRGPGGPDGAADAGLEGVPGGRRDAGLEPEPVGGPAAGPIGDPPVHAERREPDPVVEPRPANGGPAADPDHGGDELGRDLPKDLVRVGPEDVGSVPDDLLRSLDEHAGAGFSAADKAALAELQAELGDQGDRKDAKAAD